MGGAMARYANKSVNHSRLLVFALDGKEILPQETHTGQIPIRTTATFDPAHATRGYDLYQHFCMACHGDNAVAGGVLPDLRSSGTLDSKEGFYAVVGRGALENYGMVGFSKVLTPQDIDDIRQFLIRRSLSQKPQ